VKLRAIYFAPSNAVSLEGALRAQLRSEAKPCAELLVVDGEVALQLADQLLELLAELDQVIHRQVDRADQLAWDAGGL
jgi:hypothetical protein